LMPRRGNCRPSWFGSSLQVKVTVGRTGDANFETAAVEDQGVTVAPPGQRGAFLRIPEQPEPAPQMR
jgi:hypothetical protein